MQESIIKINEQFKTESENYEDNLWLKLHRTLSWLNEAEKQKENTDLCFIFLWIAFNAVYADELNYLGDRSGVNEFLRKVCNLDKKQELFSLVWNTFSDNIRIFLINKFIFQPFWDEQNNLNAEKDWQVSFRNENKRAFKAIAEQNTSTTLNILFKRLYTLRNQILHGGASFNSSVNTAQKKEACTFLLNILPAIIKIIMDNHSEDWGKPYYPLITE